jgi:hypothetical protein
MRFVSGKQRELFEALGQHEKLIFACGPKGIAANLVGQFSVQRNHKGEDQLNVDDGINHVHIDWTRVKLAEIGEFHGEGVLTFFDGSEPLFKFYNPGGPFERRLSEFAGSLV